MEELRNETTMEEATETSVIETPTNIESLEDVSCGNGKLKIVLGIAAGAITAGGILYKSKGKIAKWREKKLVDKLTKAGYVVGKLDDDEVVVESNDEDEVLFED